MSDIDPAPPTPASETRTTASPTASATAAPDSTGGEPVLLEARGLTKYFGSVNALEGINLKVNAGEVTCVLGDNGAGKSTLIKILSGVHAADEGELLIDGQPVTFSGPRDARAQGIATVFQDLATVPLMSVWRNFFLGNEPVRGRGPLARLDVKGAQTIMRQELGKMGIDVRDPNQTVGTLSGGERQALAIARAVYFGARVLILDEPTSALGVRQSGIVLKYIVQARSMGRGVIFITHNPHHAYPVGDRFVLLKRGRLLGSYLKSETSLDQLTAMMAGGAELEQLSHELQGLAKEDPGAAAVARELAAELPTDLVGQPSAQSPGQVGAKTPNA
jgi:simple sugar transport system ATP-binding protein